MSFSRPQIKILIGWASVYMTLVLVFRNHHFDPPYWDAMTGIYSQGVWLARNHFNYATLYYLPHYGQSGPNIQFFSLFAPLFALLVRTISPADTFLVIHQVVLLCGSATIVTAFLILRETCGDVVAALWILVAASHPMWLGQLISLYLEVPLAGCIMVSIFFIRKNRFAWAAFFCLLGFFVKNSALLYAMACFILGFFSVIRNRRWTSAGWLMLPYPVVHALSRLDPTNLNMVQDVWGYFLFVLNKSRFQYPTLIVEAMVLVVVVFFHLRRFGNNSFFFSSKSSIGLVLILFVFGFWAGFILNTFPLPRYTVMVIFPMACLLGMLIGKRPILASVVAVPLLIFNLVSSHGRVLPSIPANRGARSGNELERSLEYLQDLEANRAICREIEEKYAQYPIVTKWPFSQMLRVPEFGYVRNRIPKVIEAAVPSMICRTPTLEAFLARRWSHQTICIYSPTINEFRWGRSLKPEPHEKVLLTDNRLNSQVVVYLRDWDKIQPSTTTVTPPL